MNNNTAIDVTSRNLASVKQGIDGKLNYNIPYYGRTTTLEKVINDMDVFPYTRFYRGIYYEPYPVVVEREAGWRKRETQCYKPYTAPNYTGKPLHCFEGPCSLVLPCLPQYLRKYSDKDEMELQLNKSCTDFSP